MRRENTQRSSGRPSRTPVGVRSKLSVAGKDPNFEYRFVNDIDDRVAQFQDQGWEIVPAADVKVGEKRADQASPEGSLAQVSVGGGTKAFLMRQKKEWYQEDQTAKQAEIDRLEHSMKQDAAKGNYGSIQVSRD